MNFLCFEKMSVPDDICSCTCTRIHIYHCANSSSTLQMSSAPIDSHLTEQNNQNGQKPVAPDFGHSQFLYAYKKCKFCIKTFLQSVCRSVGEIGSRQVISIGFGPGYKKGMSLWCESGGSPRARRPPRDTSYPTGCASRPEVCIETKVQIRHGGTLESLEPLLCFISWFRNKIIFGHISSLVLTAVILLPTP